MTAFIAWIIIAELKTELRDAKEASQHWEALYLQTKTELESLWHQGLHGHITRTPYPGETGHERYDPFTDTRNDPNPR